MNVCGDGVGLEVVRGSVLIASTTNEMYLLRLVKSVDIQSTI